MVFRLVLFFMIFSVFGLGGLGCANSGDGGSGGSGGSAAPVARSEGGSVTDGARETFGVLRSYLLSTESIVGNFESAFKKDDAATYERWGVPEDGGKGPPRRPGDVLKEKILTLVTQTILFSSGALLEEPKKQKRVVESVTSEKAVVLEGDQAYDWTPTSYRDYLYVYTDPDVLIALIEGLKKSLEDELGPDFKMTYFLSVDAGGVVRGVPFGPYRGLGYEARLEGFVKTTYRGETQERSLDSVMREVWVSELPYIANPVYSKMTEPNQPEKKARLREFNQAVFSPIEF